MTPLHFACAVKSAGAVIKLLSAGATVDSKNLMGQTPLHYAMADLRTTYLNLNGSSGASYPVDREDEAAVLSALLDHGAQLDEPDSNGITARMLWWNFNDSYRLELQAMLSDDVLRKLSLPARHSAPQQRLPVARVEK